MKVAPVHEKLSETELAIAEDVECHPSLVRHWSAFGTSEYALDAAGERVTNASNRVMPPSEVREVLDGRARHETDLAAVGTPFFHWFDREYMCLDAQGRVVYPETSPPHVLGETLDEFLESVARDPDYCDTVVEGLDAAP